MKIPALSDLSLGQRIALTFIVVLIVLFALALIGYLTGGWDEADAKVQVDCMDPTERERIRDLVLKGIDSGLTEQIQHLFEVWTKDLSDQPRRAMVGTNNAVNAHVRARKQAVEWTPPTC
jgi:hypothetical protein